MIHYDFHVKRSKVTSLTVRPIPCYMLYIESIPIVHRLHRITMTYPYDITPTEIQFRKSASLLVCLFQVPLLPAWKITWNPIMTDNELYILILTVKGHTRFGSNIFYCTSILHFSLYMQYKMGLKQSSSNLLGPHQVYSYMYLHFKNCYRNFLWYLCLKSSLMYRLANAWILGQKVKDYWLQKNNLTTRSY